MSARKKKVYLRVDHYLTLELVYTIRKPSMAQVNTDIDTDTNTDTNADTDLVC